MTLWAFNRPFRILGCDQFTHDYYLEKFQKKFPIGGFEDAPTKDKSSKCAVVFNLTIILKFINNFPF